MAMKRRYARLQREPCCPILKNTNYDNDVVHHRTAKRRKLVDPIRREIFDFFDALPDDLVFSILLTLSFSASCPADFFTVLMTCKRLNDLALNPQLLSKASLKVLTSKAKNWSDSAHRFLELCAESGNIEACYTLGMIRFYCLQDRIGGLSLIARAAARSYAPALYSLAVIKFNGSGGSKGDKDLRAGAALCARAAHLGHVDSLRELGHCLQDGYGVDRDVSKGQRVLVRANVRELIAGHHYLVVVCGRCRYPLLSDYGCNVPAPEPGPANLFLIDWFGDPGRGLGPGLGMCSYLGCGRPETRRHEFRRCSVCGVANYCSRACQVRDWKVRHKVECVPAQAWPEIVDGGGGEMGI